ncbi:MAG: PDZ domain-containing protein, partial [Planctomycetota bacterium]
MQTSTTSSHRLLAIIAACGVGFAMLATDAAAQRVKVKAPGTTVQVGPDRGPGDEQTNEGQAAADQPTDGQPAEGQGVRTRVRVPGVNVDVDANSGGRTVRIGPDRPVNVEEEEVVIDPPEPSYWIGILGGDISPELRAHLGPMVDDEVKGVIVREIVPDSPAAEAGLQEHDILLRANGRPITGMNVLVEEVASVGPGKGRITIELLRGGQQETVWVAPAERPAVPAPVQPGFREPAFGGAFGEGPDQPFRFRMFGPGGLLGGGNVQVQANGVNVSVVTVNGKTRVKVARDGEEWDIDATDPAALDQLPADVRAIVDGVLARTNVGVDINIDELMPNLEGLFQGRADGGERRLFRPRQRRIDELERQVAELQRVLRGEAPPAAAAEGGNPALDEA